MGSNVQELLIGVNPVSAILIVSIPLTRVWLEPVNARLEQLEMSNETNALQVSLN